MSLYPLLKGPRLRVDDPDVPPNAPEPTELISMRYLRMYVGGESGEPGITLYEIDRDGWVHRQVQIQADGSRFAPEDILMRQAVNTDYMALHPAAEEIERDDFELLWQEVDEARAFLRRVPDPEAPWEGLVGHGTRQFRLRWCPDGEAPDDSWRQVPGFLQLYVEGDASAGWALSAAIFLETPIAWWPLQKAA